MVEQTRTDVTKMKWDHGDGTVQIERLVQSYDPDTGMVKKYFEDEVVAEDSPAVAAILSGVDTARQTENADLKLLKQAYDKWVTDQSLTPPTGAELRAIAATL